MNRLFRRFVHDVAHTTRKECAKALAKYMHYRFTESFIKELQAVVMKSRLKEEASND